MLPSDHITRASRASAALLVEGLHRRYGPGRAADPEVRLFSGQPPSADLPALIEAHGLSPADLSDPVIMSCLPKAWLQVWLRRHEALARRTLARVGEMDILSGALHREGLDVRFWKGPILSLLLRGDLTTRPTRDIDLMVRAADLMAVRRLLLTLGYADDGPLRTSAINRYMQTHREWPMHRKTDAGLTHHVELQRAPAMPWSLTRVAETMAFDGSIQTMPGAGCIPAPDPETHVLMMAAHHGFSEGWRRLRLVSDMAAVASLPPDRLDLQRLLALSERVGLKRTLAVGFGLAQRLAGVQVPEPFVGPVRASDRLWQALSNRILEGIVAPASEEKPGAIRWQWRLSDDARARRRLLAGHLRKRLAPGYPELRHVDLKAPFTFLYTPLKMLRPLFRISGIADRR